MLWVPRNIYCRDIRSGFKTLKVKQVEQNKKEAKMYSNMFARLSKLEANEKVWRLRRSNICLGRDSKSMVFVVHRCCNAN